MEPEPKGALNIRNFPKALIRKCKKAAVDDDTDLRGFVIKVLRAATSHIDLPRDKKKSG